MKVLQLDIFINQNENITIAQKINDMCDFTNLIEITPDMVQQVCDELQKLKTEIETGGENGN